MEKVLLYSKEVRVRSRLSESSQEIKLGPPFAKFSKKQMFSKIKMPNIMNGVIICSNKCTLLQQQQFSELLLFILFYFISAGFLN